MQAWQWGLVLRRGEEEPDLGGLLLVTATALPFALLVIVMRPGSRSLPWLGWVTVGTFTVGVVAVLRSANTVNAVGCGGGGIVVSTLVGVEWKPGWSAVMVAMAFALAGAWLVARHRTGSASSSALVVGTLATAVPASLVVLDQALAHGGRPHTAAVAAWALALAGAGLLAAGERRPPVASAPCASASRS